MTEFLKKCWQYILKFLSWIFRSVFAEQVKKLVDESIAKITVTKEKEVLFDLSSVRIDLALDEHIRSEIIAYFLEITKDCEDKKIINKTLLLLNTVSISVLKSIKDELIIQFDKMFSEPLCGEETE